MHTSNLETGYFGRGNLGRLFLVIMYDFLSNIERLIKLSLFHKYSTIIRIFIILLLNIDSKYDIYIYNINNIQLSVFQMVNLIFSNIF